MKDKKDQLEDEIEEFERLESSVPKINKENKKTGFYSRAYIDHKTKTIVVAYQGTDIGSKRDLYDNDVSMAIHGKIPKQFSDAENFYRDIKDKLGDKAKNYNIVFTGHSLGGTLAELMGAKYGNETVTFNAYGANQLENVEINHRGNIINYGHIKDKVFNAPFSSHIGDIVQTDDSQSSKWPFRDYHKAENIGDLGKYVFKKINQ